MTKEIEKRIAELELKSGGKNKPRKNFVCFTTAQVEEARSKISLLPEPIRKRARIIRLVKKDASVPGRIRYGKN